MKILVLLTQFTCVILIFMMTFVSKKFTVMPVYFQPLSNGERYIDEKWLDNDIIEKKKVKFFAISEQQLMRVKDGFTTIDIVNFILLLSILIVMNEFKSKKS